MEAKQCLSTSIFANRPPPIPVLFCRNAGSTLFPIPLMPISAEVYGMRKRLHPTMVTSKPRTIMGDKPSGDTSLLGGDSCFRFNRYRSVGCGAGNGRQGYRRRRSRSCRRRGRGSWRKCCGRRGVEMGVGAAVGIGVGVAMGVRLGLGVGIAWVQASAWV